MSYFREWINRVPLKGAKGLVLMTIMLAACLSCGLNLKEGGNDPNRLPSYKLDIDEDAVSLFPGVLEALFLDLETPDSIVLDFIKEARFGSESSYYIPTEKEEILVFDREGQLVNAWQAGKGYDGEFYGIRNFYVLNDTIYAIGRGQKVVLRYDLLGNLVSSEQLPYTSASVYPWSGGYLMDTSLDSLDQTNFHKLAFYHPDSSRVTFRLPQKFIPAVPLRPSNSSFNPLLGTVFFQPMYSDTVYRVDNINDVRPFFRIDFDYDYLWSEPLLKSRKGSIDRLQDGESVWGYELYNGQDNTLINYHLSFIESRFALLGPKGEFFNLKAMKDDEEEFDLRILAVRGDRYLFSLPADEVPAFSEKIEAGRTFISEGKTLEKIGASKNRVLVWIKFKKFKTS